MACRSVLYERHDLCVNELKLSFYIVYVSNIVWYIQHIEIRGKEKGLDIGYRNLVAYQMVVGLVRCAVWYVILLNFGDYWCY